MWWSWILTAIGLTGWWLTGRRLWQGWAVACAVQVLWLAYALTTGQYGFIVASIGYGTIAALNLRRWLAPTDPVEHLHYRHQPGMCPDGADCPGHRAPAGPDALALLDDLRNAGRLSYIGPGDQPTWMTRLNP